MKDNYEKVWNIQLPYRMPVILRLDGKNFHSFTKKMERPFDETFIHNMGALTEYLCKKISTTVFAYVQSDEISLLLHPYKKLDTDPWFANEIQKISSVSAGLASSYFSLLYNKQAVFDARVFVLPEAEVVNYFVWRQQDATRNSVTMAAQTLYSHRQLDKQNSETKKTMMLQKGVDYMAYETYKRRGFSVVKKTEWITDWNIPLFTEDRDYVHKWLEVDEE